MTALVTAGLKPKQTAKFAQCLVNITAPAPVRKALLSKEHSAGALVILRQVLPALLESEVADLRVQGALLAVNLAVAVEQEHGTRRETAGELADLVVQSCIRGFELERATAMLGGAGSSDSVGQAEAVILMGLGAALLRAGPEAKASTSSHEALIARVAGLGALQGDAPDTVRMRELSVILQEAKEGAGAGVAQGGGGGGA